MSIGTKLKALRFSIDISEEDLAKSVGVTEEKIKFWEKDLSRPNNATLSKIAEFFKIDLDFFFEDDSASENKTVQAKNDIEKTEVLKSTVISQKDDGMEEESNLKNKVQENTVESAKEEKIKNFKRQIEAKKKNSAVELNVSKPQINFSSDSVHSEILAELKKLNDKIDNMLDVIKNKPSFTNIKQIETTYSMDSANGLLKKGWILLELFKDEKGFLGYRLGRTD
ncbi:helix-turn-helix transcriptional regulator [Candidatus Dependentiae bacterium]|nr:helix-turn-helix transcriptional regulator [Candidatus Dependentiae bacterium]